MGDHVDFMRLGCLTAFGVYGRWLKLPTLPTLSDGVLWGCLSTVCLIGDMGWGWVDRSGCVLSVGDGFADV